MRALAACLVLGALGCHGDLRPNRELSLLGSSLELAPSTFTRLAVMGDFQGSPVEVQLEVARPLSAITRGCFPGGPPTSYRQVRVPLPAGGMETSPQITVEGLRLGVATVPPFTAALWPSPQCAVTLGVDVLGRYALRISPRNRMVSFEASRPHAFYEGQARSTGSQERALVELSRDPLTDVLMLPVRIAAGAKALVGTFVLATDLPHTVVSRQALATAGLSAEEGDEPTDSGRSPSPVEGWVSPDSVELDPGLGLRHVDLRVSSQFENPAAVGILGPDVWSHFEVTLDPSAKAMLLERPRCSGGRPSDCVALRSRSLLNEVDAILTVDRDFPQGARFQLEPLDVDGKPLTTRCRFAVTLPTSDRGLTAFFRFHRPAQDAAGQDCPNVPVPTQAMGVGWVQTAAATPAACAGTCAIYEEPGNLRPACQCAWPSHQDELSTPAWPPAPAPAPPQLARPAPGPPDGSAPAAASPAGRPPDSNAPANAAPQEPEPGDPAVMNPR